MCFAMQWLHCSVKLVLPMYCDESWCLRLIQLRPKKKHLDKPYQRPKNEYKNMPLAKSHVAKNAVQSAHVMQHLDY